MSKIPPSHSQTALPVVGVDVSKAVLDAFLLGPRQAHQRFENTAQGHQRLLGWVADLSADKAVIAMESTGAYHLAFAMAAFAAAHRVLVFNPRRVREFARSLGRRNKTDKVDAALIARFAQSHPHQPWQPLPQAQAVLRDLLRRQDDLETQLQAELRRLETASAPLRASLQRSIRWNQAELRRLEKLVHAHLQSAEALAQDIERLEAIPGVGVKTARLLAAEVPRHFRNARAVAAWLGAIPRRFESGTLKRPSHVGHEAPSLRTKLYFPALTAMRHDPRFRAFAQRLREAGKAPKSIVLAVLHKLIRTAFAILTTGAAYQPTHVVCAPRTCSP
jgi:transposase